jgi:hypothetical protein
MKNLIVVAPTFYSDLNETRYRLGLEACKEAARCDIRLILVDASPIPDMAKHFVEAGMGKHGSMVTVLKQKSKGRKGSALREAIQAAVDEMTQHSDGDANCFVAFQELEKVQMIPFWASIVKHMECTSSDICVPRRADKEFKASYPIEQYHQENFVNLYVDTLAVGIPSLDWTMGPIIFRMSMAKHWTEFIDGELWDAQLVPLVRAARRSSAKISSFEVQYEHPKEMKTEEEFSPQWCEKRLYQTNFLFEHVGNALKEKS